MNLTLNAQKRIGKVEAIRAQGNIPAVVYGPHMEAMSFSVDASTFNKIYQEAGESTLINLSIDGAEPLMVLIQDIQVDPVKRTIIHADFRHVTMGEEMDVTIPLVFVGVSLAEKEQGGTLLKPKEELNVRCLPQNLVDHIDIDLSVLKTFSDAIHVSDIVLPPGLTVLDGAEEMIATVNPPLSADQLAALEQPVDVSLDKIEVEAKGKKEEESADADKK